MINSDRKARLATFDRILASAPPVLSAPQLRVFLSALVNLDPYDFAEDVAAFYVEDKENNQQTPEEVLLSTLTALPDVKLTELALRLALTGHTDTPRGNDFDFLAQAKAAFAPSEPKKKNAAKKPQRVKAEPKQRPRRKQRPGKQPSVLYICGPGFVRCRFVSRSFTGDRENPLWSLPAPSSRYLPRSPAARQESSSSSCTFPHCDVR